MAIKFQLINKDHPYEDLVVQFLNINKTYMFDSYYFATGIDFDNVQDEYYEVFISIRDYIKKAKDLISKLGVDEYTLIAIGIYDEYFFIIKILKMNVNVFEISSGTLRTPAPLYFVNDDLQIKNSTNEQFIFDEEFSFEMSYSETIESFELESIV